MAALSDWVASVAIAQAVFTAVHPIDDDRTRIYITYANPNVFYELGMRHACRCGTILLRQKDGPRPPFDVSHMRYLEFENTSTGLKELAAALARTFQWFDKHPGRPDNAFLEQASLTGYEYPAYGATRQQQEVRSNLKVVLVRLLKHPKVLAKMASAASTGAPKANFDMADFADLLTEDQELAEPIAEMMLAGMGGSSFTFAASGGSK